jgi:pyrimidine operon attenuation protein/uracil phosphoribosyltransferase
LYVRSRLRPQAGLFLRGAAAAAGGSLMSAQASFKPAQALDANAIARAVKRIAHEIVEHDSGAGNIVLVGIVRRGARLAERLAEAMAEGGERVVPVGTLDISSYRDDGRGAPGDPRLLGRDIPFALDRTRIVLVDDVLYTGRTVRAALDALADLGHPESFQLAVLVDRGERELPIRADYVGRNIEAPRGQRVYVRLAEVDGVDEVVIGGAKKGSAG